MTCIHENRELLGIIIDGGKKKMLYRCSDCGVEWWSLYQEGVYTRGI